VEDGRKALFNPYTFAARVIVLIVFLSSSAGLSKHCLLKSLGVQWVTTKVLNEGLKYDVKWRLNRTHTRVVRVRKYLLSKFAVPTPFPVGSSKFLRTICPSHPRS
jgi:hypothetical protein